MLGSPSSHLSLKRGIRFPISGEEHLIAVLAGVRHANNYLHNNQSLLFCHLPAAATGKAVIKH